MKESWQEVLKIQVDWRHHTRDEAETLQRDGGKFKAGAPAPANGSLSWSKQQDLATEASLHPTSRYHVHPPIGGPCRGEVCQLQVAIPDLVVVPQLVMPTLALLGEKEDGTWGALLWEGWWLVGYPRHWVEEAWQLRVFHVARDWHTLHTYQDPWGTGRGCELPGLQLGARVPESSVALQARCCLATVRTLWVQAGPLASKSQVSEAH